MSILKIEPQVTNNTANFAFGNVFAANYYYANGAIFSGGGGGGSGTVKYTANANPPSSNNSPGDQWFNTTAQVLYEYINDGTSNYWVDILSPTISSSSSTLMSSGNSNIALANSGNLTINIEGTSDVLVVANDSVTVTGNILVSGNIVGNLVSTSAIITDANVLSNLTVTGNSSLTNTNIVGTLTTSSLSVNSLSVTGWTTMQQSSEVINLKTGATGTVIHDLSTGASFYHTSPVANFTANFTNVSTTDARATVAALVIIQGSTPYVPTAVQIEGSAYTIKWIGSTAPAGTASKTDIISFTLMRMSNSWSVYGQYSNYG